MTTDQLAELSRFLYAPTTLLLYASAAVLYLYALTTKVERRGRGDFGRRAERLGLVVAGLGITTHVAHEVVRGLAQQRFPLGNMFEFTSAMALAGVVAGLVYLQFVRKRPELNGFVLVAGTLVLASALLVYSGPAPLQPILDTWWRHFHVSLMVTAAGILTAGFVFTSLYLLRDTAERRVAEACLGAAVDATVGPAYVAAVHRREDDDGTGVAVAERVAPDTDGRGPGVDDGRGPGVDDGRGPGIDDGRGPDGVDPGDDEDQEAAYRQALLAAISPWRLAVGTFLGVSVVSWVFLATPTLDATTGLVRFLTVNLGVVAAALLVRRFVGHVPPAATLDGLAYRTISLGFFVWTFGVIAGAMWAEQSWGRFWGWDPKETGSFLTWVAYAAYLHARATRGARGRGAGWIGLWAFAVLMFTYYGVNLVIVGLHSYAGI
jgi:ABC-type transport system involved in cytochrome c biogenesis permease subunit